MANTPRVIHDEAIEHRIIRNAKAEKDVQLVKNFHGREGWWSRSNQLGFRMPFQPPVGRLSSPMTLLRLDEAGLPRVWTLALGVEQIGDIDDGGFDGLATIDFGAGGGMQTVQCDWNVGTVISMPMNALNVKAQWIVRNETEDVLPDTKIFLIAQLSRGALSRSIATRSFHLSVDQFDGEQDEPGDTEILKLPSFTRSVNLIADTRDDIPNVYSPNFVFEYLGNVNGAQCGTITGDFMGPDVRFPIPPFARYFRIRNYGPVAIDFTAQFNLFDR